MAKIKLEKEEVEIKDGEDIRDGCLKLGVPFSCSNGVCGTCMINVVKGEENLSKITEEEKALKRDRKHRLACQCRVKKGEVEITL